MKKLYKIIIGALLMTIVTCITLSITYSRQVDKMLMDAKVSLFNNQKFPNIISS